MPKRPNGNDILPPTPTPKPGSAPPTPVQAGTPTWKGAQADDFKPKPK